MEWISINEKLPKIGERYFESIEGNIIASEPVLVSKGGDCVMYGYFEKTHDGIIFWHISEDLDLLEDYVYKLDEISHWMPLPKPATIGDFIIERGVLKKYIGKGGKVVIPYFVTSIGEWAFKHCEALTSIVIPDSVERIEDHSFYKCPSLTSVTIGKNVKSIGSFAFHRCTSLTSVMIPDGAESIDGSAFNSCTSLTSVTIPDSVKRIGGFAFNQCTSLTSINIPGSVKSLDYETFAGCTSLTSVTIGDGTKVIGSNVFDGCKSLTSITIPDSVKSIGGCAFASCTSLTSITIPDSVESMGWYTFSGCTSLTSITLPNSLRKIEEWTFKECKSLTSITIPNSVTSIGEGAFLDCISLRSADIPNSVQSMGLDVFKGCTELNKYVFISYKREDKNYAEAMRHLFIENGIKPWMDLYDIPAGSEYSKEINDAVVNASCVFLVLSERAQSSRHIDNEIRIAFSAEKTIVAMNIDECQLKSSFNYFLGSQQIISVKSLDKNDPNVQKILEAIKFYIR